jgi:hypothetical protein
MSAWDVTACEATGGSWWRRDPVCGDSEDGRAGRRKEQEDGLLRAPPCTSSAARTRNARHTPGTLIDRPGRWCGADSQIRPAKRTSFILNAVVFDALSALDGSWARAVCACTQPRPSVRPCRSGSVNSVEGGQGRRRCPSRPVASPLLSSTVRPAAAHQLGRPAACPAACPACTTRPVGSNSANHANPNL